jgi:hypothetical protein
LQQDGVAGLVLLAPQLSMQRTAGAWMGKGWRLALPLLDCIWPTLPLGVAVHGSKQPELVQDMYAGEHALWDCLPHTRSLHDARPPQCGVP